jgi:hypothetical protein
MSTAPRVSVAMTVHNDAPFIAEAVESILRQSFTDLEFIIIDDGSTDGTTEILRRFDDPRLRIEFSARNRGIATQANRALDLARGHYIARMDGDDIALPDRLARQVALLEAEPEVVLCGAWAERFDEAAGTRAVWRFPTRHEDILPYGLFRGAFCNPLTMLRRATLERHGLRYDPSYPLAEDMHLWYRLLRLGRGANLPEVLLRYRLSPSQVTQAQADAKPALNGRLWTLMLADLGLPTDPDTLALHAAVARPLWPAEADFLRRAVAWLEALLAANEEARLYDPEGLRRLFRETLYWRCRAAERRGLPAMRFHAGATFTEPLPWIDRLRSWFKTRLKPAQPDASGRAARA